MRLRGCRRAGAGVCVTLWDGRATIPELTDQPVESSPTPKRGASLPLLTVSRLQAYRRCPREEQLRYQKLLRSNETEALRFGTLVHRGLEAWWKADPEERLVAALQVIEGEGADRYEQVRAECLLRGYDARWSGAGLTAIAVEHEFLLPLVNPDTGSESRTWQLGGKMDALAADERGRVFVIEHKTSSADIGPGSNYIARLRLDGQVSMYLRAARELGHDPAGVLYDVIGKVKLRPLKRSSEIKLKKDGTPYANVRLEDETPDEYRDRVLEHIAASPDDYYQRATVVRLEEELREFERELWQMGTAMKDAVRLGVAPRNSDACGRYGEMCAFFPLCTGMASEEQYARSDRAHTELSKEIA